MYTIIKLRTSKRWDDIFSLSMDIHKEYLKIVNIIHPDRCNEPDAESIFKKITEFKNIAIQLQNPLKENLIDGVSFHINYPFGPYELYVGSSQVYFNGEYNEPIQKNMELNVKRFQELVNNSDIVFKNVFSLSVPKLLISKTSKKAILKFPNNGYVPLISLLNFFNGKINPVHVAWIINRMLNWTTFLDTNGFCSNSLTLESFFVNPENHRGYDIGTFLFMRKHTEKLIGLLPEVYNLYPPTNIDTKTPDRKIGITIIKKVAAKLLGDPTGNGYALQNDTSVPKEMIEWIQSINATDCVTEFENWEKVLEKVFGIRKFVELKTTQEEVFKHFKLKKGV